MPILPQPVETALARYMAEHGIPRDEAVRRIVTDWLGMKGYGGENVTPVDTDTAETVQYPEFMSDASGGAGG